MCYVNRAPEPALSGFGGIGATPSRADLFWNQTYAGLRVPVDLRTGTRRAPHRGSTVLEIVSLGVALFEIHLDLNGNADTLTTEVKGFNRRLLSELPSLRRHRCWSGESGDFVDQLEAGTDFAHVIEHVILELQHLADPDHRVYSGWTEHAVAPEDPDGKAHHTVHFQTRSFDIGSAAARQAVGLVTRWIRNEDPDVKRAIRELEALAW